MSCRSSFPNLREARPSDSHFTPPSSKRSVTIAGHATSITLEPAFWAALEGAAADAAVPLNALVARVDAERLEAADPPNLASALRLWLFARANAPDPTPPATPPG